jgi:carbon monoxide dehydrogenase subunit G
MEMKGEQIVPASQQATWEALNDPQVLKACVPGCESIDPTGPDEYQVLMVARVGPVSAKFKGKLTLYDVKANVGGKLAQIGSRLVDAAAKKVADDFFRNFNERFAAHGEVDSHDEGHHDHHPEPVPADPDLPKIGNTTLVFFAAGALVVYTVAMLVLH